MFMDETEMSGKSGLSCRDGGAGARRFQAARLGDSVRRLMAERVLPRQGRFESICEVWSVLLPAELCRHCRLVDISGGQLKVAVDSPSYMHELRLCGPQLLAELQKSCPGLRLQKIKFTIG
jgi:hypothetical protein